MRNPFAFSIQNFKEVFLHSRGMKFNITLTLKSLKKLLKSYVIKGNQNIEKAKQ